MEEARAFAMALNALQPYCPPMLFGQVIGNPITRLVERAANGEITIEEKSNLPEVPMKGEAKNK